LTDPDGGQRLRIPSNGSKNSTVEATSSIRPPEGAATTASPGRPLIAGERSPRKDGKPLRSLHPQPPPNAPPPQARKPINLPSAKLERPAQPLPQAIPKDWAGLKPAGASWVPVYDRLSSAVKVSHYSPKKRASAHTFRHYAGTGIGDTVLPATYCKRTTIFARFKSCWGTVL